MIQAKAPESYSRNVVAIDAEDGVLVVNRRKYIAENKREKKLLEQLYLSDMRCNSIEAVIHMVCKITVFKERTE